MDTYIVDEEKTNIRIDKAIGLIEDTLSRVAIQRLLDEGNILVNGKTTKASYKTKIGDEITIQKETPKKVDIIAQDIPIEILYEDEDIIVVNKPKGIVVHPANGNPDGTLVNAIMNLCGNSLSGIGGEIRPGIIHRLDKDTSGVLIVAKNDIAHINISNQIKNRQTKKIYIALVRGVIKENEATIDMPIGRSKKDRKKMAVTKDGKEAITHFKVLKRYENFTLLEIKIDTGRTHQIRVHLAEIGYPIVGDYIYSNGKNPFNVEGQMLHARQIEFVHPTTGKEMKIEAPIPEYFQRILNEMWEVRCEMEEEKIRLQKYLAECGIASRRKAEEYIQEGKVQVNGKVVTELGVKINPEKDIVYFNNKKVAKQNENIYILLNKPIGYVTTTKDQFNRETVLDLIKGINKRIVPVGRLDMYTSGALILTNDGDFTYKVTHPSHEITKTYVATLRGIVTYEEMEKLKSGVEIEDYLTRPAKVKILKTDTEKNISRIEITIHEGKNRQVRKMCEAIGRNVMALHRSKIGNIGVKDLKIGEWRYLSSTEIKSIIIV